MRLLCLLFIFMSFTDAKSSTNCLSQKDEKDELWAMGPDRQQAGGWVWFLGKGVDQQEPLANLKAEGIALERLKQECQVIPAQVKFIERCTEHSSFGYRVFARASVQQKFCSKGANKNTVLENRLQEFVSYKKKNSALVCNLNSFQDCMDIGDLNFSLGKYEEAYENFLIPCNKKVKTACLKAFFAHSKANPYKVEELEVITNQNKAITENLINKSCNQGESLACFIKALKQENKSLIESSCKAGYYLACGMAVEGWAKDKFIFNDKDILNQIITTANKMCEDREEIGCEILITYYIKMKLKHDAQKVHNKVCTNEVFQEADWGGDSWTAEYMGGETKKSKFPMNFYTCSNHIESLLKIDSSEAEKERLCQKLRFLEKNDFKFISHAKEALQKNGCVYSKTGAKCCSRSSSSSGFGKNKQKVEAFDPDEYLKSKYP